MWLIDTLFNRKIEGESSIDSLLDYTNKLKDILSIDEYGDIISSVSFTANSFNVKDTPYALGDTGLTLYNAEISSIGNGLEVDNGDLKVRKIGVEVPSNLWQTLQDEELSESEVAIIKSIVDADYVESIDGLKLFKTYQNISNDEHPLYVFVFGGKTYDSGAVFSIYMYWDNANSKYLYTSVLDEV